MVINDIEKHIAIGREIIVYSKTNINSKLDLKIGYKINKEEKEIRLYDVPKILTFQEKVMIYYAILDKYYFYPLRVVNKEFEGLQMPIPVGYDAYLKMAFGDYMQLPPKEKQIPKHEAVLIDVDRGYEYYRGKNIE